MNHLSIPSEGGHLGIGFTGIFEEITGGVEMTDELEYSIPFGPLGRLAHNLFVGRQVKSIFEYRYAVLNGYFNKK